MPESRWSERRAAAEVKGQATRASGGNGTARGEGWVAERNLVEILASEVEDSDPKPGLWFLW